MASRHRSAIDNDNEKKTAWPQSSGITRLLSMVRDTGHRQLAPSATQIQQAARVHLVQMAEAVFEERLRRVHLFGSGMFGEPAWDMLLACYISDDRKIDVATLFELPRVPTSTASRWFSYLEREGLLEKTADEVCGDSFEVQLSSRGRELLDAHFIQMING